ncbi:MAG TPA: DUF1800 domain-containing protein [Fimbriimonas sp.]|nr:DUF1800 domain-containing protein [Fimbriimonas sp.]
MTEREKIAHLLRRFGLGAGKFEVDQYAKYGVEGTIDRLINYDKVDEQFPVDPWELTGYGTEGLIMFDPPKFAAWWSLRMVMTQRPLQERLTLFWHDHFAVSAEKVGDGPNMLAYMQALRTNANGNFRTLLKDVSKSAAMVFYLDTHRSTIEHPNENFAREALELFTLGIGNYSEKDIKEAARAFTGWSLHYIDIGSDRPYDKVVEECARKGTSPLSFCFVPSLHDGKEKTILGKTGKFDGDQTLDLLCDHPACAKFITKKLASWFIEGPISDSLQTKLANVFTSSGMELKPVLLEIAHSDEFWADSQVRKKAKSPVDYYVTMFRQLSLQPILLQLRGEVKDVFKPMRPEVKGTCEGLLFLMNREGFLPLYPPNVGGWNWGSAWITSANMTSRIQLPLTIFRGDDKNRPISQLLAGQLVTQFKPDSSEKLVDGILQIFDGDMPAIKRDLLVKACNDAGGVKALGDKETASVLISEVMKLLVASPDYQTC